MYYGSNEIKQLDRVSRLKLINSICGIRGVHLIGSISSINKTNLAIFSSVVHVGSNPPILGFITRPNLEVKRDTYNNIIETNYYTINSIERKMIDRSHQTSGKYDTNISEFDVCQFHEQYINNFIAPYVAECKIKIGLKLKEIITINSNNSNLIVGEIEQMHFDKDIFFSDQTLDLEKSDAIGISGLNRYYKFNHLCDLPYARISELPKF